MQSKQRAAAYLCFYLPEGKISSVQGVQEVQAVTGVRKAFLEDIRVGMTTSKMTDKTMRLGPILIEANNYTNLKKIITEVQNTLKIEGSTLEGNQTIIW